MSNQSQTPSTSTHAGSSSVRKWLDHADDDDQTDRDDDEADYDDDEDEGTVLAWHGRWSSHPEFGAPVGPAQ
jgi:hypothetical protein